LRTQGNLCALTIHKHETLFCYIIMTESRKVVTPVKTGVQKKSNYLKKLDTGFRRYDDKRGFRLFTGPSNFSCTENYKEIYDADYWNLVIWH
jgi:hypothetical protein